MPGRIEGIKGAATSLTSLVPATPSAPLGFRTEQQVKSVSSARTPGPGGQPMSAAGPEPRCGAQGQACPRDTKPASTPLLTTGPPQDSQGNHTHRDRRIR